MSTKEVKKHENQYVGTSSADAADWLADVIQKVTPKRELFE